MSRKVGETCTMKGRVHSGKGGTKRIENSTFIRESSQRFYIAWGEKAAALPEPQRTKFCNLVEQTFIKEWKALGLGNKIKKHYQMHTRIGLTMNKYYLSSYWVALKTIKLIAYYNEHKEEFNAGDREAIEGLKRGNAIVGGVKFWRINWFNYLEPCSMDDIEQKLPGLFGLEDPLKCI